MLYSPKLLIHHNYKGILYYYKNYKKFNSFTPNSTHHFIIIIFHYLNAIH
jgi:hypothetical protein